MPLYMRLPKRGFSNAPFSKEFATVTLGNITAKFEKESTVSRESLITAGLLSGKNKSILLKYYLQREVLRSHLLLAELVSLLKT